jgi:serine/threonine protein kinase/Flp pilus assembly protein TadD
MAMTERDVFEAALELLPRDRAAYLHDACGDDAALRQRLEALLGKHDKAGSFLEHPLVHPATTSDDPIGEAPGTVIGPYKLMEQIGEGGMGLVFVAEQQQPVRRKVALKVIKPGMDTRQVVARFEAERQALALMDHPNIARVLDGGETAGGRPYFVMELVKGIPITEFCDQHQVSIRERLQLFVSVGLAVQHAHQKGIIHRDLKPSNVLVMSHDGTPVVKVIDFGVAKAIGQQLTDKTVYTQFTQMIGTPLYMSPEQAGESSLDVDTRSDIYSLGVLLYELLTGTTPFDKERFSQVGYDEIRRIIREEEPPKPSTRISTLGQAASTFSTKRKSDPKRLSQLIRGELDWVVMKCLEKDRNRRYDTANSLAKDIERYLQDEPVQACPPSFAYRLRKFIRRNRTAVAAAALVVGLLLVAVFGLTVSNIRITQEKAAAEANFRKARQAVEDQFTLVSQSTLFDVPGSQYLRKELLESALKYYQEFLRERPDDPELQADVAVAYFRLYEIYQALDSCMSADAILTLEKGVAIVEQLLRHHPPDAALYQRLAGFRRGSRFFHAVFSPRGKRADPHVALPLLERAARIWEDFVRDNPTELGFQIDLAAFYLASSEMKEDEGGTAEQLVGVRKAHALCHKLARDNPQVPEYRAELAWTHDDLADLLIGKGEQGPRSQEVEKHRRRSLELREKLVAECPAVTEYRQALAVSYCHLGDCFVNNSRLAEGEQAYRQGLKVQEKLAADFPNVPSFRGDLAIYHDCLGRFLHGMGQFDKAEQGYRQGRAIWEKLAADFPTIPAYRERLAWSSFRLCQLPAFTGRATSDQWQELEQAFRKALDVRVWQPDNPGDVQDIMAWILATCPDVRFRDPTRALKLAKEAIELNPFGGGGKWTTLGVVHYRLGNWKEAIATLEKATQLGDPVESNAWFFMAMAQWKRGDKEQARKWYDRAVQWMEKNLPESEELRGFRAEAGGLLGIKDQPATNERETTDAKAPGRKAP